jgi:chemotaxis protein MotB
MVEPTWIRRFAPTFVVGCALAGSGCAVVPKSQLDECHQVSQTLQADNSRLKDTILSLRSKNEDLTQREVDDAKRLEVQDREIQRLTADIGSFQEEREQLAAAYQQLKRQIESATNPLSAKLLERIEEFARGRPGCEFDREAGVLTFAADQLFEPGTDRLKPAAKAWLLTCADLLKAPEAHDVGMLVTGHTDDSPVQRVDNRPKTKPHGHLSLDRASRVRDELTKDTGLDPARIDVAGFESSRPREATINDAARGRNRRIEIHLFRETGPVPAVAAGP